jgi:ATP-dependent DNA helicase RecG
MSLTFETKISGLAGISKPLISKLKKLKIETVEDLIFYYPYRFEDYSQIFKIKDLPTEGLAVTSGRLELIANRRTSRRKMIVTEAILTDDSGSVKIVWFNQPWVIKNLKAGDKLTVWGRISGDFFNPFFNSPEYHLETGVNNFAIGLRPVYSLTAGLALKQLSGLIKKVLSTVEVYDFLPATLLKKHNLVLLSEALNKIHFPKNLKDVEVAKKRLAFNELFLARLWTLTVRKSIESLKSVSVPFNEQETKKLVNALPFELTLDQKKSAWTIIKNLEKETPMNRLLEGDVGSGKTIVVLLAMFNCFLSGKQAVLMAPTEVLAMQHYQVFLSLLRDVKVDILLFTASHCFLNSEPIKKKELLNLIAGPKPMIIIGTHALIQSGVKFNDLALVAVDEQHRFGVKQRQQLKLSNSTGLTPHFLSMTATPIPRSLSLAIFGDLDISLIRNLPLGRKPIISRVVEENDRFKAYSFIGKQLKAGRQAFVICPLIDPSDKLGVKSVTEEQQRLDREIFKEFRVGLLHGRLKAPEKNRIMEEFKKREIDILVATSVIEVGIDIPNASVMMIEGADRFGLAQLHQFRGRVGRSEYQSYCFVFTDSQEEKTLSRLKLFSQCSDGFKLAEYDLENRGAGNYFGEDQSGFSQAFKLADLNDVEMIKTATLAAKEFFNDYKIEDHPLLKERLNKLSAINHLE